MKRIKTRKPNHEKMEPLRKFFDCAAHWLKNYDSDEFGFYAHQPDLAVHLDLTPERAEVVNDTIWEVCQSTLTQACSQERQNEDHQHTVPEDSRHGS